MVTSKLQEHETSYSDKRDRKFDQHNLQIRIWRNPIRPLNPKKKTPGQRTTRDKQSPHPLTLDKSLLNQLFNPTHSKTQTLKSSQREKRTLTQTLIPNPNLTTLIQQSTNNQTKPTTPKAQLDQNTNKNKETSRENRKGNTTSMSASKSDSTTQNPCNKPRLDSRARRTPPTPKTLHA